MLVPYLDSVSNHNRQITASNASVSTHSPFLLVGDYAPPTRNTEFHSVPTRTANALKGDAKMKFPFKACISMTFGATVKQGSTWKMGWQNTTPSLMRLGQNLLSKRLENSRVHDIITFKMMVITYGGVLWLLVIKDCFTY